MATGGVGPGNEPRMADWYLTPPRSVPRATTSHHGRFRRRLPVAVLQLGSAGTHRSASSHGGGGGCDGHNRWAPLNGPLTVAAQAGRGSGMGSGRGGNGSGMGSGLGIGGPGSLGGSGIGGIVTARAYPVSG